jgi:hypothetical protein
VRHVALAAHAAAGGDQVVDALVAAQCRLNAPLAGHVGAQPHRGQHVEAVDVVAGMLLFAGNDHPAGAVAAGPVVLRQAVEADGQHVLRQRRDRGVRDAVVKHLVVHLVGIDDQVVLARDLDDFLQHLVGIHGAGRIVRIDDDDGARLRRDLGADVGQIRHPARALVAQVMARRAAGKADRSGPQRVIRGRHQHFVAVVEQAFIAITISSETPLPM